MKNIIIQTLIKTEIADAVQRFMSMTPEKQREAGYKARHQAIHDERFPVIIRNAALEIARRKEEIE